MLDGLLPYEKILLLLGVLLFLVLLALLVFSVLRNRNVTGLLAAFVIPLLMIGFPGVQSFKFGDYEVTLNNAATAVAKNPSDPAAQQAFEAAAAKFDPARIVDSPLANRIAETRLKIAETQVSSGQPAAAQANLSSALALKPDAVLAARIREQQQRLMVAPASH